MDVFVMHRRHWSGRTRRFKTRDCADVCTIHDAKDSADVCQILLVNQAAVDRQARHSAGNCRSSANAWNSELKARERDRESDMHDLHIASSFPRRKFCRRLQNSVGHGRFFHLTRIATFPK
jgi:hypothetical protein